MIVYTIIEQALLHVPLVLGAYISIALMKVPDLSIESAYVFGAILSAQTLMGVRFLSFGVQLLCVSVASLLGGAFVGLVSSSLTSQLGFPHLLSSIVTFGLFHGIIQAIASSYISLTGVTSLLGRLDYIVMYPELITLLLLGIFLICGSYYFFKTELAYSYAVYGSNASFFSRYGISTKYVFMSGIIVSNALAGLSGFLCAQSGGFAELNMGLGKALLCVTALLLGQSFIHKKIVLNSAVPIVGIMVYFALQQILLKIGFNLKYFTMVQSGIVLLILMNVYQADQVGKKKIDHLGV